MALNAAARIPAAPAPVVPPPADGASIGEIRIRRLGVSVVVVQGESEAILQRAVGHLARTALPGVEGNVVLAGHRDTFFRPLKDSAKAIRLRWLHLNAISSTWWSRHLSSARRTSR